MPSTAGIGNNETQKIDDMSNPSNEFTPAPDIMQTMAGNAQSLKPVPYPVPFRQPSIQSPGLLDIKVVATKTEDGGLSKANDEAADSSSHDHDAFMLYSNVITRRMTILGLDENDMVAPADQIDEEENDDADSEEELDQEDHNIDNMDEDRSNHRETRISFELHPNQFFLHHL